MFIWTFLITKTYEITSCSYALKSWNTLYFYTKTKYMHLCIKFILFLNEEWHSTCFGRSFRPSSGVQDFTYNNQTDTAVCLLANRRTWTVRLLSFMTGIIKSICLKEMTLLLLCFPLESLVTVHTNLHGHTASACLFRNRPFSMVFNVVVTASWMSEAPLQVGFHFWEQNVISRC